MTKPRLLDLFCGAGGAAMGYSRAGFEVVGVDVKPQPRYPFEFIQADAMTFPLKGFDAVHASPPCQRYSSATKRWNGRPESHPDYVDGIRWALSWAGVPWVIENVPGSPLRDPLMLCGTMFGLGVKRHRLFESSAPLRTCLRCDHFSGPLKFNIYDHGKWQMSRFAAVYGHGGGKDKGQWNEAMGVDWMTGRELVESVPPAYTEFIGAQLMAAIEAHGKGAASAFSSKS